MKKITLFSIVGCLSVLVLGTLYFKSNEQLLFKAKEQEYVFNINKDGITSDFETKFKSNILNDFRFTTFRFDDTATNDKRTYYKLNPITGRIYNLDPISGLKTVRAKFSVSTTLDMFFGNDINPTDNKITLSKDVEVSLSDYSNYKYIAFASANKVNIDYINITYTCIDEGGGEIVPPPEGPKGRLQVYETNTSKTKLLAKQKDLEFKDYVKNDSNSVVNVKLNSSLNSQLYGYGCALTHSSAYLLANAKKEVRDEILTSLFSIENGAAFSTLRIPLGTSDFTLNEEPFYTFDDINNGKDYELTNFSIEKDERFLIPMIKEILKINPDIQIFASPWSAPAWMKTNNSLIGDSLIGNNNQTYSNPSKEEIAYAEYLYKSIKAYSAQGIDFDYITIVNEPNIKGAAYPSMYMDVKQYFRVSKKLCELLDANDLNNIRIDAFDHNPKASNDTNIFSYLNPLFNDPLLSKYVSGLAMHCYNGNWSDIYYGFIKTFQYKYSNKELHITEITEHQQSTVFGANLKWAAKNVTIGPVGLGVSSCMYWNLCLDANGEPKKGNDAALYGVVTLDGDNITYSSAFYAMAQVSKFAHKVNNKNPQHLETMSTSANIKSCAFLNGDGTTTICIANTNGKMEMVDIVINSSSITYKLQPGSIVTFVY